MSRSSTSSIGSPMEELKAVVTFAGVSASTAIMSFFVATLPVVQWFAALTAVVSGTTGVLWIVVQYRRGKK